MKMIAFLGGQEHGQELAVDGDPPSTIAVPDRTPGADAHTFRQFIYAQRTWRQRGLPDTLFYVLDGTTDAEASALMREAMAGRQTT